MKGKALVQQSQEIVARCVWVRHLWTVPSVFSGYERCNRTLSTIVVLVVSLSCTANAGTQDMHFYDIRFIMRGIIYLESCVLS